MLLILAGVALNSIFGQGSLIGNAQNAVDEYNKKVEEERLALEQIEEYFKNNGVTQTATLQLVDKGEDFIKVKVDGENYEEFEFSIDNGEYVSSDLPEYTFNNLEITTVTGMDTLVEEGTMHTIKAKAKNKKSGEIEELNSIQVATDVLVESDQVQYFKYEDNGEGITITELVPFSEIVTDKEDLNEWNNFFDNLQDIIIIPSYIDNKPVTKVSKHFIRQVANINTYVNLNSIEYYIFDNERNGLIEKNSLEYDWKDNSCGISTNVPSALNVVTIISVSENQIGKTDEIEKISSNGVYTQMNATFDLQIQNGIVKNGKVKLILPPSLNEIVELDTLISKEYEKLKEASINNLALLPTEIIFTLLKMTINSELNNSNINNTTIYMLGQTNQEKQILKEQIGIDWNAFTQVKVQE